MKKLHLLLLTAFTLLFATLACNLPSSGTPVASQDVDEAVEAIPAAGVPTATVQVQAEDPPAAAPLPSQTPTPSETPTVTTNTHVFNPGGACISEYQLPVGTRNSLRFDRYLHGWG